MCVIKLLYRVYQKWLTFGTFPLKIKEGFLTNTSLLNVYKKYYCNVLRSSTDPQVVRVYSK